MRISRVHIENFRNFADMDVALAEDAVIVGENKVGKSNFIYALRLVLDPSLPDSARQLRAEDFWDGVARPIPLGTRIRISVELAGFDEADEQLASLADFLVQAEPMVARLTYEFRHAPMSTAEAPSFEFTVFGGDREDARVSWEVRRRLALDVVHALRDAEGDLASWRRSPLRPLLAKVANAVQPADKERIVQGVTEAAEAILELDEVDALGEQVGSTLASSVLHLGGQAAADRGRVGEGGARSDRHAGVPLGRGGADMRPRQFFPLTSSYCVGDTDAVGARPLGASPYGALDMVGNVMEWVADWYNERYYSTCTSGCTNPQGPATGVQRVLRGSFWSSDAPHLNLAIRGSENPLSQVDVFGFRCAK